MISKLNILLTLLSLLVYQFAHAEKKPLFLVIDDLGYSLDYGKQAINLPGNHSYAIIPETTYAQPLAKFAIDQNKEVMMHLPMQSTNDKASHEKVTLNSNMDENHLIENTQRLLKQMPYISGLNNHMGSQLTQIQYMMRPVMETIYQHNPNLYFLDSRTSPKSTAFIEAKRAGLKALKRNIFLDHHPNQEQITFQFNKWLKRTEEGKPAIAIVHPSKISLSTLKPLLDKHQETYEFLPLSQFYITHSKPKKKTWQQYLSQWRKDAKTSKQSP